MAIKILGDSTSDITPEQKAKYGITTIPMYVNLEDRSYRDGENLTCEEMFEEVKRTGFHPKSACPTPEDVMELLRRVYEPGDELIYIGMSGEISPIIERSTVASSEAGIPLHIVDTRVLSTGVSYLMILASEMIREGKSADEIVETLNHLKGRLNVSFVIDTMTYLFKGGRCSAVSALMASTLKIKPQIVLKEGKMVPAAKFRGNIARALDQYFALLKPSLEKADPRRVFITHTFGEPEIPKKVSEMIASLGRFHEILEVHAGCVIGTHCGPGTLGIIFLEGE